MSRFCLLQRRLQLVRKRRGDVDALARQRMCEGEPRGMEKLPLEPEVAADPVHGVTRERQADRLEVHPDLVRPPRLEPDTQQRALAHEALDLEEGDGLTRRRGVERVPVGS